jgi:hypothetical protein
LILVFFDDVPLIRDDYEGAAAFTNALLPHGIAATDIDMLICAVAFRTGAQIFSTDPDFTRYAEHLSNQVVPALIDCPCTPRTLPYATQNPQI